MMTQRLRRSPHFGQHVKHGAKNFFNFAGWEMPEHFTSLQSEVEACRTAAILFDGHAMGEVYVKGPEAHKAVQYICANDIKAEPGRCFYTSMLTPDGGIFDDLVVLCIAPDNFLLTVAAFNVHKSGAWIKKHIAQFDAYACDESAGVTCIEVQGPKSREILRRVTDADISHEALPYFRFVDAKIDGIDCTIARLGVTGELGYEIFYDPGHAWSMYDILFEAGKQSGMQLAGNRTIGMFRLEKVYHIYTRDIDETTNPVEAGLDRWVKVDKGNFVGRDAILRIRKEGPKRRLVGFEVASDQPTAIPPGTPVQCNGANGKATIGGFSPTLKKSIGLAYLPTECASIGNTLTVKLENAALEAKVVETPFFDPKGKRIHV
jgi:aminomethyltransferase